MTSSTTMGAFKDKFFISCFSKLLRSLVNSGFVFSLNWILSETKKLHLLNAQLYGIRN